MRLFIKNIQLDKKIEFPVLSIAENIEDTQMEIRNIANPLIHIKCDIETILEPLSPLPKVILYYAQEGISKIEIAQVLRATYPQSIIFFIAKEKKDFDKKRLIKNGFTDAFLLPWEKVDLLRSIREESSYSEVPELRNYKSVKVVDLYPGTVLDFDLRIYMPLNHKFLPFSREGEVIDEEKLERLEDLSFNTLFVHKDDVEKFHKYTANVIGNLLKKDGISETEKQVKLESCIRELVSDMFIEDAKENTFSKSNQLLQEVKDVLRLLIDAENHDLCRRIETLLNHENNFYVHLSNVSAFAGMFAIALGFEKPQDMALAGLLHDIGKINLPPEIAELDELELKDSALEAHKKHPQFSIDIAKLKRLVLPDSVIKAILQHHEKVNGTGYPKGLNGPKISSEGRLLAIADQFDELTSLRTGSKNMSLAEAIRYMLHENMKDPGNVSLDIEMLKKLNFFFLNER